MELFRWQKGNGAKSYSETPLSKFSEEDRAELKYYLIGGNPEAWEFFLSELTNFMIFRAKAYNLPLELYEDVGTAFFLLFKDNDSKILRSYDPSVSNFPTWIQNCHYVDTVIKKILGRGKKSGDIIYNNTMDDNDNDQPEIPDSTPIFGDDTIIEEYDVEIIIRYMKLKYPKDEIARRLIPYRGSPYCQTPKQLAEEFKVSLPTISRLQKDIVAYFKKY